MVEPSANSSRIFAYRRPNRQRLRQGLLALGFVVVATFWLVVHNQRIKKMQAGNNGFENVSRADEEDFVVSTQTAITTVKLPERVVSFDKPPMDPNKPNLILHVGPVKAGVEAIAREIVQRQPQLHEALQTMSGLVVKLESSLRI